MSRQSNPYDPCENKVYEQELDDNFDDDFGDKSDENNEYAIDRAHKIGFFVEQYEFRMTLKDVETVQRRFKLFKKNWRLF